MDYSVVKSLVIDKLWKNKKWGDEYRSFVIQIENVIRHIQDENSPFRLLPTDIMTEDEMISFICHVMSIKRNNRELLNNIKQPGLKRQLSDFIIDTTDIKSSRRLQNEFPTLGNIEIKEVVADVKILLRMDWICKRDNLKNNIAKLTRMSEQIRFELERECGLAKMLGVGVHNPRYMEEYIDVVEAAISEIIVFGILLGSTIRDKRRILDFIWEQINRITDQAIQDYAKNEIEVIKKVRDKHIDYKDITDFTEYLALYMARQSLYDEIDKINDILVLENDKNPSIFAYHQRVDDQHSLMDKILLGEKCPTYKQKMYETYKIIKKARSSGNDWVSQNSVVDLRVVFREVFISKSKHDKRQAMRIARAILSGEAITQSQILFLDAKIMRGYFCEWGILEWYSDYIRIMQKIRQQLLLQYKCFDDSVSYKAIDRIFYDFCDIVYHYEER